MTEAAPLMVTREGERYGVTNGKVTQWLPPALWPHASALVARMAAMNSTAEYVQNLYRQAEEAAWDEAGAVKVAQ
jgi:hypothetical protein